MDHEMRAVSSLQSSHAVDNQVGRGGNKNKNGEKQCMEPIDKRMEGHGGNVL